MLDAMDLSLGALREQLVFVGGSVLCLYHDPVKSREIEPRPTIDVDAVIHVETLSDYQEVEKALLLLGFRNCTTKGAPICRYENGGRLLDLMPDNPGVLGFSNVWYEQGMRVRCQFCCPVKSRSDHSKVRISPFLRASLNAVKMMGSQISGELEWAALNSYSVSS
jgi:hypothetical protein